MTTELADILKQIVSMLYREAGQTWCSQMMDRIDAELKKNESTGTVTPIPKNLKE